MDKNYSLKDLSKDSIAFLISATNKMFAVTLLGESTEQTSLDIEIPELIKIFDKKEWKGKSDLFNDIRKISEFRDREIGDIKNISATLYSTEESLNKEGQKLSSTTAQGKLEYLQEKAKRQAEAGEAAKQEGVRKAEEFIERTKKQAENRKLYTKVKIDSPKLPEEQEKAAGEILDQIKNTPTEEAINLVKDEIKSRVPEEITEDSIELTASVIVANVQTNFVPTIQAATVIDVTEKPKYSDLAALLSDQSKTTQELQNLTSLTQNVTELAFGKAFREKVLPDIVVEDVSDVPSAGFVPIQIPPIYKTTVVTEEVEVITFGKSWVQNQLSQKSIVQGANYDPKKLQSSFSVFKPLTGFAKDAATNTVKKLATKAGTKVAVKATTKLLANALAIESGGLSKIIEPIVNWLVGKIDLKKVKEWSAAIAGGLATLIALPFVSLGAAVGIGLGTTAISLGLGAGLGGLTLGGIGAGVFGFFGAIGAATAAAIGIPILIVLLGVPVTVAFILFIINSGAYVVPPSPYDITGSPGGIGVVCTDEKGPVGVAGPNSTSSVANRAWEITYDLYQGFWCYWNRSPKAPPQYFPNDTLVYPDGYPNAFDYEAFKRNPNTTPPSGNLFWCTMLVRKAYEDSNISVPNGEEDLNSQSMFDHWPRKKILPKDSTPNNIVPGSVVFFQVHGSGHPNRINHVGVVYSVDPGGLVFVESNAGLKSQSLNYESGVGFGSIGTTELKGFGLP